MNIENLKEALKQSPLQRKLKELRSLYRVHEETLKWLQSLSERVADLEAAVKGGTGEVVAQTCGKHKCLMVRHKGGFWVCEKCLAEDTETATVVHKRFCKKCTRLSTEPFRTGCHHCGEPWSAGEHQLTVEGK